MESHMNILFGADAVVQIALALILLVCCLYFWKPKSGGGTKPPEPAGAWPVVGHLPLLGAKVLLHHRFGAMADEYGPAFMIRLGSLRAVVVNSSDLAKESFTNYKNNDIRLRTYNDSVLATRPKFAAGKHMFYNYCGITFAPDGPFWGEMRKFATSVLFSSERLRVVENLRVSEIGMSIEELHEKCRTKNDGKQDELEPVLVDMTRWFQDLTLNVVVRMVAGKQHFLSTDRDDEESSKCRKVVADLAHLMGIFVASDALPMLRWFDMQGFEGAMKKTFKDFDALLSKWLHEHRQNESSTRDLMDAMLHADNLQLYGCNADTAIKATCLTVIAAGSDTTVVTLTWALSLLLNDRDVLEKAQAELDRHVGRGKQVRESDINKLVYLKAIVKETLRLYPAAPLGLPHQAKQDCTIGGFRVPADTVVFANIWKIHRDPQKWSDPSAFRPERHLNADLDTFKSRDFEFMPFGGGRRMCLAASLAANILRLTLARLLNEFDLRTPSGVKVDMSEGPGVTLLKETPLEVLITPRLPLNVNEN